MEKTGSSLYKQGGGGQNAKSIDRISGDSISDDISDSCLVQGNKQLRDRNREDVAAKLWNKSIAFGVVCELDHGVFIGEIKEMEIRDEEANVQKEVIKGSSL